MPSTARFSAKQVESLVSGIVNDTGPTKLDVSAPQTACTYRSYTPPPKKLASNVVSVKLLSAFTTVPV